MFDKCTSPDYGEEPKLIGRDGVIRTHDPLHPMQVRYQAALRPDEFEIISVCCFGMIYEFTQIAQDIEYSFQFSSDLTLAV